jgi:hypothetical protein
LLKLQLNHDLLPCLLIKKGKKGSMIFRFSSCLLLKLFMFFSGLSFAQQSPDPGRSLKLTEVVGISSSIEPTTEAARYGLNRLLDGKLPKDGWRSTWTAWYQKDPVITFDLGSVKKIGVIRVFFQAWAREDELKNIDVEVSIDGENFELFNRYGQIVTLREKGTWVEMDLRAVSARYFRLGPRFQGWGHHWGEVEFWEIAE